jgi:hypothetical protein
MLHLTEFLLPQLVEGMVITLKPKGLALVYVSSPLIQYLY